MSFNINPLIEKKFGYLECQVYTMYMQARAGLEEKSKGGIVAKHDFIQENKINDAQSTEIWEELIEKGVLNEDGSIKKPKEFKNLFDKEVELGLSPKFIRYEGEILNVLRRSQDGLFDFIVENEPALHKEIGDAEDQVANAYYAVYSTGSVDIVTYREILKKWYLLYIEAIEILNDKTTTGKK